MKKLKKIGLVVLVLFYLAAGINHFLNPAFYINIIPHYFPAPVVLNVIAGCCEILLAILMTSGKTRRRAAWGIVLMLIAFIPVHVQMVLDAPLTVGTMRVSALLTWIRLVILQPLLIWWAWWYTKA